MRISSVLPSCRRLCLALLLAAPGHAQVERYELGLRLRAFERHLGQVTDEVLRDAAYEQLDRAVQAFFRLDTATVAKAIAAADRALDGDGSDAARRFACSLQLALDARLVDAAAAAISGELSVAYRTDDEPAEHASLVLVVQAHAAADPVRLPIGELPLQIDVPLTAVPAGDHLLRWSIVRGDEVLMTREQGLSVASDLAGRCERVAVAAEIAKDSDDASIECKTLPALWQLVRGMQRRRAAETDLPGARLLREAEQLADWLSAPAAVPFYGDHRPGSFWLRVPVGKSTAAVRLFVPPADDAGRALVLALHGAGGSENLFFDGYGDGLVVDLAAARGWFVVAPRLSFGGIDGAALVAALAERFSIDREKVLMVGHSMGAMQAVQNAMQAPRRFRAVAALGGGGRVRRGADSTMAPFFVGVGARDFALAGARQLHRALTDAGAASELREYPGVEHLAIVQLALPDVFAWFERVLAPPR